MKVWDLSLQHCCQTLIGFKGEVWSLAVDPKESRVVAGCVDSDLRVYAISNPSMDAQQPGQPGALKPAGGSDSEDEGGDAKMAELISAAAAGAGAGAGAAAGAQQQQQSRHHDVLIPMGTVRRTGQERVSLILYDPSGELLGVMGAGKGLEVFRWVKALSCGPVLLHCVCSQAFGRVRVS